MERISSLDALRLVEVCGAVDSREFKRVHASVPCLGDAEGHLQILRLARLVGLAKRE